MTTQSLETVTPQINQKYVDNFTRTIKSLLELLDLEKEDEYGTLRPVDYSFKTTINLLIEAYGILGEIFPKGAATTDDQGGIRINWKNRDKNCRVCLFCPSNSEENAYIYHQYNDDYGSDEQVSVSSLVKWLSWFNEL